MKTISKAIAFCTVVAVLVVSGSAWADGYRHQRHDGEYYGSHVVLGYGIKHLGHHGYKKRGHYDGKLHSKDHGNGKRHYGYGGYNHSGHGYAERGYAKHGYDCHPVSKVRYHHGRKARFGGTMCYDAYGYGYVVPGSRYLIGYLY